MDFALWYFGFGGFWHGLKRLTTDLDSKNIEDMLIFRGFFLIVLAANISSAY